MKEVSMTRTPYHYTFVYNKYGVTGFMVIHSNIKNYESALNRLCDQGYLADHVALINFYDETQEVERKDDRKKKDGQ